MKVCSFEAIQPKVVDKSTERRNKIVHKAKQLACLERMAYTFSGKELSAVVSL